MFLASDTDHAKLFFWITVSFLAFPTYFFPALPHTPDRGETVAGELLEGLRDLEGVLQDRAALRRGGLGPSLLGRDPVDKSN